MVTPTTRRGVVVLAATIAATLLMAVGVAIGAVPRLVDTSEVASPPSTLAEPAVEPVTSTAPPTTVPEPDEPPPPPPTTVARVTPVTAAPTTVAPTTVPPTTTPPPPRLPPGQRIEPSAAAVQAAIAQLHQRVPLFSPTDGQLRTFAEAVCATYDQGLTQAQVEATVSDAVSRIQGASLSPSDAAFTVRLVVSLRCPGYLP